jgi:hypothetical protein
MTVLTEEFIFVKSGSVGDLSWLLAAGSGSGAASEPGIVGIYDLNTGTVSGTYSVIHNGGLSMRSPDVVFATFNMRTLNNDANTMYRLGLLGALADPPDDGVYFEKLTTDSNWFYVCRAGTVQTRVDSGIALDTNNFLSLTMTNLNGNAWRFSVQDQAITDIDTNVPAVPVIVSAGVRNNAAANKRLSLNRIQFEVP